MFFIREIIFYCIQVLLLIMLINAVLSFVRPRPNKVTNFVYDVSEILCRPMRILLGNLEFVRSCPIDIPFFVTWIIISQIARMI